MTEPTGPTSYDPFRGHPRGYGYHGDAFPEARFRRVGATDDEVAELKALFDQESSADRRAVATKIRRADDEQVAELLARWRGNPEDPDGADPVDELLELQAQVPSGAAEKVTAWIDEAPDDERENRVVAALVVERRGGRRKGLTADLEGRLADTGITVDDSGSVARPAHPAPLADPAYITPSTVVDADGETRQVADVPPSDALQPADGPQSESAAGSAVPGVDGSTGTSEAADGSQGPQDAPAQ